MNRFCCAFSILILFSGCKKTIDNNSINANDTILQKNGNIVAYPKPTKKLITINRDNTVYSKEYEMRLRKISEFYLAKTQQKNVIFHLENPNSQMGYSIEENDWEDVKYTQIGIFTKSSNNISTLQWLFYEPKSQQLFEFDLSKKQLKKFNF